VKDLGKIRTKLVKRTAKAFAVDTAKFSTDFAKNKAALDEMDVASTKKLRNQIAGYITRKVKQNAKSEQ